MNREEHQQEVATAILKLLVESKLPKDDYYPVLLGVKSEINRQIDAHADSVVIVAREVSVLPYCSCQFTW